MEVLYKAQVRSSLEYTCLAWGDAASKHLVLLNKVQGVCHTFSHFGSLTDRPRSLLEPSPQLRRNYYNPAVGRGTTNGSSSTLTWACETN
ncbi:hypothetical protein E2C01_083895 [Portunus trituberculatus]|uniref:Uncharacterized protein n=1 Tax=Portunus trituberculatus TaxID=210409 RepID=A0A5B7J7S7_PORTR|nr:hypothetical protein [Portunus trituberculatus]